MNEIKILHTGDIQVEVRDHQQRYDEFEYLFSQIENIAVEQKPDIYLIAGDVFEFNKPNDIERLLVINHMRKMLELQFIKEIVITHGNHDIDQRKFVNFFKSNGEDVPTCNALDSIVYALNNNRISLLNESTYYVSKMQENLVWINWSQKVKHSNKFDQSYNPLLNIQNGNDLIADNICITLYHDPIQGAKQWDSNPIHGSNKSNGLDVFITNTILAGDIHIPQVIENRYQKFVYCGSPIARDFGEGDYYTDGRLTCENNSRHTVSVCSISDTGYIVDQEFITLKQYKTYNTFEIKSQELHTIPFELKNCGLHFSDINVKLPAPTETWISLEPKIIELLNNENKNHVLNIKFSYGKAITDEQNELVQNATDIESLISKDKIVDVATLYIEKQVNKSKSISNEDKESCIKYITDTFVSEMNNFTTDMNTNNIIKFDRLTCNNFMSFGDNILIDFNDYVGLTKLVGGNGVGKTTMYNLLKWILTGYINTEQNAVRKKENTLTIFNDYRFNVDTVYGGLMLNINGVDMLVERMSVREWNKNTTDEQKKSEQWKEFISSASTQIKLTEFSADCSTQIYESTVAESMLHTFFGGLENLERLLFVNQFSLLKFVCSEPARLCEEILTHIGMNFFDKMSARYDDLRNEKMKSLSKPSISVDEIIKRKNEVIKLNETLFTEIDSIANNVAAMDLNLASYESDKNKYLTALNNVTEADVNNLVETYEAEKNAHTNKINLLNESLATVSVKITEYDMDAINSEINTVSESINNAKKSLEENETKLTETNHEIELKKRDITSLFSELRQHIVDEITKISNNNINLKSDISTHKSKIIELKSQRDNEINTFILNESKSINDDQIIFNEKINTLKDILSKINENDTKIDEYKKSTICPTCNRKLEADDLEHINTLINNIDSQNAELAAQSVELQDICLNLKHALNTRNNDLDVIKSANMLPTSKIFNDQILVIENAISLIEIEITNNEKIITEKNLSINDHVLGDERFVVANNELKELIQKIQPINDLINTYNIQFYDETTKLVKLNDKIKEYDSINERITNIKHGLEVLAARTELFTVMENNIIEKKKQYESDKKIQLLIDGINPIIDSINESIDKLSKEETEKIKQRAQNDIIITEYDNNIAAAIQYRIAESSLKQYKSLIGKQGLPQHIFSLIKPILNSKLNDLLEDMDFRLYFDEGNYLQMLDLSKETHPVRQPMFISGMQVCFCALSLLYVNRMSNNMFIIKELFIDEVSGQLNDGQDLSYETLNYQEQLKKLLKRFTGMNIWIIDHVIDDLEEDNKIEVIPTKNGAQLNSIKYE